MKQFVTLNFCIQPPPKPLSAQHKKSMRGASRGAARRELGPDEYARLAQQAARLPVVDDNEQHHTESWSKIEEAMNSIKESQRLPGDTRIGSLPRPPPLYCLRDKKAKPKDATDNELKTTFEQL